MKQALKYILFILIALALFFAGFQLSNFFNRKFEAQKIEDSEVILEQIKRVAKFITTENHLSEIFTYKEFWPYDIPGFTKKAMIRVKAKVSIGYDLSNMHIEVLEDERVLLISDLPAPEILSIDHDLDYYDISQGMFNRFNEQDYTEMQKRAKGIIEDRVNNSNLSHTAEEQGRDILQSIEYMAVNLGWEVRYQNQGNVNPIDTLLQ